MSRKWINESLRRPMKFAVGLLLLMFVVPLPFVSAASIPYPVFATPVNLWPASASATFIQFTQSGSLTHVSASVTLSSRTVPSDMTVRCFGSGSEAGCWVAKQGTPIMFWRIRLYVVTPDGWSHLVDGYGLFCNFVLARHPCYATVGSPNPLTADYPNAVGAYIMVEAVAATTLVNGPAWMWPSSKSAITVLVTQY